VAVREAGAVGVGVARLVPDGALAEPVAGRAGVVPAPAPLPEADVAGAGLVVDAGALAVPLNRLDEVAVGPAPAEGEKIDGTEDVPPVQAVSIAEQKTVMVTQPAAVSLALLTFMRPPYIPAGSDFESPAALSYLPAPRTSNLARHGGPAGHPAMARFPFRY
jgi:hypothetical protein